MLTLDAVHLKIGTFELRADLKVQEGDRVAIIGASGSGKSTLLAGIAGFLEPVSGRMLWQTQDLTRQEPGQRPLSMVFQDQNLFPHLTVAQNVGLGIAPSLRLSNDDKTRVGEALDRVGLTGLADRKPAALSGGQQSRVALARVMLRARPILLLDEPFAALGPGMKGDMLDLVAEVADRTGATVLMVTHDPADARRFAGRTILVANGQASAPVPTNELLDNPPPVLAAYLK